MLSAIELLHLLILRSVPINSDEPQHLHVVWSWTQGLVPYRDFFDNHTPLFHAVVAPVLAVIGETPDIVAAMRLAILPLTLLGAVLLWRTARRLWDARVAFWGVLLAHAVASYAVVASEFRADALWAVLWFAVLAVAFGGRWTALRAFGCGLLVGAALATSLKTVLLIGGFAIAALIVQLALPRGRRMPWRTVLTSLVAFGAGLVLVPAVVLMWLAAHGAIDAMVYDLVQHNAMPGLGRWSSGNVYPLSLACVLVLLAGQARRSLRSHPSSAHSPPRWLFVLSALASYGLLYGLWPLLSRQDHLPLQPVVVIGIVAALSRVRWISARFTAFGTALLALELAFVVLDAPPWQPRDREFRAWLGELLVRTRPGETVMDAKGEAIFRRRPYHYVLETITRARIENGSLRDDIIERLVASGTRVVASGRLTDAANAFVAAHYVEVAPDVWVAGANLPAMHAGEARQIELVIAADYALDPPSAALSIDGHPCRPSCRLAAGTHAVNVDRDGDHRLLSVP